MTKAQTKLMTKAAADGFVRPYGSEWTAFYSLRKAGLMDYAQNGEKYDFTRTVLTADGLDTVLKAAS